MKPIVLDAGALIALERREARALALLDEIVRARVAGHVPSGVVAQVWRGSARQHPITRLLRADALRMHELTERLAYRIGLLVGSSGTSDVVDAHVAILGRALGAVVLTSDPDDLRRLDPDLHLVVF